MKLIISIEVDVSSSMAETMMRSGFEIVQHGSNLRVKVPNAPMVAKHRTRIKFDKLEQEVNKSQSKQS